MHRIPRLMLAFAAAAFLHAQEPATYRTPSPALAALVDTPQAPLVSVSSSRRELLLLERPGAPSIAELAQPELRLAGLRIDPGINGASRALTYSGLVLQPIEGGAARRVTGLPEGARVMDYVWSRSGANIALTVPREKGIELWVVDVARATARRLTGPIVNAVFSDPVAWIDETRLVIRRVPEGRGRLPAAPTAPAGPVVQENQGGRRAAVRTFEDLLENPHDEALFDYYATSELATVTLDGAIERAAPPAVYTRAAPSPDARYFLVESLHRPYSYLVPSSRFPTKAEIFENGRSIRVLVDSPLTEANDAIRAGPRAITWRADAPATLSWWETLGGRVDPEAKNVKRDSWRTLAAPFTGRATEQAKFEFRPNSILWCDDSLAIITESSQRTRVERLWRVAPGRPEAAPELLFERSSQDRYADPGRPALVRNALGRLVMQRSADGTKLYFTGAGASPDGDRPFLDEFDLATKKARRVWRAAPPHYEDFVTFIDASLTRALMRRESIDAPGGYFIRTLGGSSDLNPVVTFANPHPQLSALQGEIIRYKRADGVALHGTLYLPPGYKPAQGPLPTLLWAYPREHLSADTAEQINAAPERFVRISTLGPLPFLLAGYAVLSDPAMPIIGQKDKQPNDTYVEQLTANAKAAIDELVRRGVSDPKRIAVGGHSYGAFMTANLLAHTDLFCAGIARSGAYNRTLTPFGFQNEQRSLWQAPAVYAAMSPFNYADKIKEPILLIHGEADNNSGTFPIQSERFYAALKGHGATTRFVLLPHESHAYRARESVLHMLWEMETWLDTHVKKGGAKPGPAAKEAAKDAKVGTTE